MIDQQEMRSRTATDHEVRKMAVEIVMFDDDDRATRQAKVNIAEYLAPVTKPLFRRLSRQS